MNNKTIFSILYSWSQAGETTAVHSIQELLEWIGEQNSTISVSIHPTKLKDGGFWFYDKISGRIRNQNNSFFSVSGIRSGSIEQPIIIQDEIGYLGIICQEINGVIHFLMQAKIEPGNINKIQISPTIQATKSNFTQKHGGKKPAYLEYFTNISDYEIVVDQIQSEQASRFLKKRNRNIIIRVDEEIEVLPSHRWMTLWQIKKMMRHDNLVNMDTRTVLSCIPFCMLPIPTDLADKHPILRAGRLSSLPAVYHYINDYKMYENPLPQVVPLDSLANWVITENGIHCKNPYSFEVIYCDISIANREVITWSQPMFRACGKAVFGLIAKAFNGQVLFLVKATPEIGCFDGLELGPSVQIEALASGGFQDSVSSLFFQRWKAGVGILQNVLMSEEGGRFYHEQNHNVILEIEANELNEPPPGYFWLDFYTLNTLTQINNCLNIQLRNLLSLLNL